MRLAFFENNDITPETWKYVDFDSLSKLILNKNIGQDSQEQEQKPTVRPSGSKSHLRASLDIPTVPDCSQPDYSFKPVYSSESVYSPPPNFVRRPTSACRSTKDSRRTVTPRSTYVSLDASKPSHSSKAKINQRQLDSSFDPDTFGNQSGRYLCEEPDCGKIFPSLRKLRHHKVVHSNDFPFICQFQGCGKRFKRKFGIDLHSTTHFDLDPEMYEKTSNNSSLTFFGRRMQYSVCKPCNQKFKTVHDYQDHMLRHGKEPFKCLVEGCGQTFSIWKSFQKHRASHYFNYYCKMDSQCGHSTSNLQLLKLHIYCCHFRRTLPENASSSREHTDLQEDFEDQQVEDQDADEQHVEVDPLTLTMEPKVRAPRRDPRLRRNPPRSSLLIAIN